MPEVINPDKKELKHLQLYITETDGTKSLIAALSNRWITRKCFASYVSLISGHDGLVKTGAELEEWTHHAEWLKDDFEYLLSLKHHVFWSYMVYCKEALAALVSFLQHATPFYTVDLQCNENVLQLYERLLVLSLRIICRTITSKESADAWLSKEHMRELIYTNYLISIPMLFDLVVAVGDADSQNKAFLQKVFAKLLEIELNYKQDMKVALQYINVAFRSIQTQTENEGCDGAGGGEGVGETGETPYDDVSRYCLDCSYSLSVLLEVCPESRDMCAEIGLGQSIARFYDGTIPFLYKNIYLINENASSLVLLNQARLQLLRAFRSISYSFVDVVLTKHDNRLEACEHFVALLTECLSEQTFVIDYQRAYPVEHDMEILRQANEDIDDFKASFVVKGYQRESEAEYLNTIGSKALLGTQLELNGTNQSRKTKSKSPSKEVRPTDVAKPMRDFDLEVTAVLDVLPHLGTGFVRRVLERYESSEEAIAAILEENLPPDLLNINQSEEYIPPDPQDKLYEETGVRHLNVYDGDAYDVMTQANPACIIKQGKGFPNVARNAAQLLDDKSDLAAIRHRYQEYTLVAEGGNSSDENGEYDDEYDDSYEALLESERVVKSKQLKAGLADIQDVSEDEESEEEQDNGGAQQKNSYKNFCENPEVVRARYEAQRQAKWQNRGGGGSGARQPSQPNRDVVGAPKGQGQDKDTLRNRNKKETNKASRANHNRKAGASFKRSKGMMG